MTPSIKEALEPVLSFLDELAANAVSGKRQPLNPIVIGGSAKLYAEGLRAALATFQPDGERRDYRVEFEKAWAENAKLRRFLKCSRDEGTEALDRADKAEKALEAAIRSTRNGGAES